MAGLEVITEAGKGQILFMSPDFDAPLEDFAEYR